MEKTEERRPRRTLGEEFKKKILALFEHQDFIIAPAVAEKLDVDKSTAYRYLTELALEGKVGYQNSGSIRIWFLKK